MADIDRAPVTGALLRCGRKGSYASGCRPRIAQLHSWLYITLLLGVLLIMSEPVVAQTQGDLDKAKLAADIAEQQKKTAEAKKAAAAAEAEAAAIATKSANDLIKNQADADKAKADAEKAKADAEKAKTDADKAKVEAGKAKFDVEKAEIEAFKAGLPTPPDPTKYKVDKPSAPTLNATVGRLTFEQAKTLAGTLAPKIFEKAKDKILVGDDGKLRALTALATATSESLTLVNADVTDRHRRLDNRLGIQPLEASPTAALAIGSLLENVLAYATILRTQYGFGTASTSTNAEAALVALVLQAMPTTTTFVDMDGVFPQGSSDLAKKMALLKDNLAKARTLLADAPERSRKIRDKAPEGATDAEKNASKAANVKAADDADKLAEALAKSVDEAQKFVVGILVVDAQGTSPFDAAQRGETLKATLAAKPVATLTLKVISSDADTVATDRLFSGFKVFVGTSTVARWKVVDSTGVLLGAGADMVGNPPERIQLTDKSVAKP